MPPYFKIVVALYKKYFQKIISSKANRKEKNDNA